MRKAEPPTDEAPGPSVRGGAGRGIEAKELGVQQQITGPGRRGVEHDVPFQVVASDADPLGQTGSDRSETHVGLAPPCAGRERDRVATPHRAAQCDPQLRAIDVDAEAAGDERRLVTVAARPQGAGPSRIRGDLTANPVDDGVRIDSPGERGEHRARAAGSNVPPWATDPASNRR